MLRVISQNLSGHERRRTPGGCDDVRGCPSVKAGKYRVSPPRRILTSSGWAIEYVILSPKKTSVCILCSELNALRPRERQAEIDRRLQAAA